MDTRLNPIDANRIFLQTPHFLRGVTALKDLPSLDLSEIAFAGRSNVGKSSLINALFNRKDVARTSNTPGRTQQLNFFQLSTLFIFVDLPGYGYASASKTLVAEWNELLRMYLKGRPTLKRVYLLIDSRHGLKPNDREMMEMLDLAAVSYQIILTKSDQIDKSTLESMPQNIENALAHHPAAYPKVLTTSARLKQGLDELRLSIWTLAFNNEILNDEE